MKMFSSFQFQRRISSAVAVAALFGLIPALFAQTGGGSTFALIHTPADVPAGGPCVLTAVVPVLPVGGVVEYRWQIPPYPYGGPKPDWAKVTYTPVLELPEISSQDLGAYTCGIFVDGALFATSSVHDVTCTFPATVQVVQTTTGVRIIGTPGDDDVQLSRDGSELVVTVLATPDRDTTVHRCPWPGGNQAHLLLDLGPGTDFAECNLPSQDPVTQIAGGFASALLLGGGETTDCLVTRDVSGLGSTEKPGWGYCGSGLGPQRLLAGRVAANSGQPMDHVPVVFTQAGPAGTITPWTQTLMTNSAGRFLGILTGLPGSTTTPALQASVSGGVLLWSGSANFPIDHEAVGVRPYSPCVEANAPGLWIPFDETEGQELAKGYCRNVVLGGGYPAVSALLGDSHPAATGFVHNGRSFSKEGGGTYRVAPDPHFSPGGGSFSFNCGVRRGDSGYGFRGVPNARNQVILDRTNGSSGWKFGHKASGQLWLQMGTGGLVEYTSPTAILRDDNAWHLVAVTVNRLIGIPAVKFYIDGVLVGAAPISAPATYLDDTSDLLIGPDFWGDLDELEFYVGGAFVNSPEYIYDLYVAGPNGHCLPDRPASVYKKARFGLSTEFAILSSGPYSAATIASLRDPLSDADGDGFVNRLEFGLGSNAALATSVPEFVPGFITLPTQAAEEYLSVSVRRAGGVAEVVVAEMSSSLTGWAPGVLVSSQPQPDGTVIDTWRDTQPVRSSSRRFSRVTEIPEL